MQSRCIVGLECKHIWIYCMNRVHFTQWELSTTFLYMQNEQIGCNEHCMYARECVFVREGAYTYQISGTKSVDCRLVCKSFNHSIFRWFNFARNKSWYFINLWMFFCIPFAYTALHIYHKPTRTHAQPHRNGNNPRSGLQTAIGQSRGPGRAKVFDINYIRKCREVASRPGEFNHKYIIPSYTQWWWRWQSMLGF